MSCNEEKTLKDLNKFLNEREGVLEQWLEIYCPNCSRFTGQWFKNIEDIPEQVNCFNCGEDIENPLKHAVVIYRVL